MTAFTTTLNRKRFETQIIHALREYGTGPLFENLSPHLPELISRLVDWETIHGVPLTNAVRDFLVWRCEDNEGDNHESVCNRAELESLTHGIVRTLEQWRESARQDEFELAVRGSEYWCG